MSYKSWLKITFINIGVFLVCVLIIEIIFGDWFSKYNLGPYMRDHRLKKNPVTLLHDNKTYNFFYKRNSNFYKCIKIAHV